MKTTRNLIVLLFMAFPFMGIASIPFASKATPLQTTFPFTDTSMVGGSSMKDIPTMNILNGRAGSGAASARSSGDRVRRRIRRPASRT